MNITQKTRQVQQQSLQSCVTKTDAYSFFNLLTSPQLLDVVEAQLPNHRERLYPPTTTLSLFMAQALNSDSSCQNTIDQHAVERVFNDLPICSTITGAYCKARQRLPTKMVSELVKQTGQLAAQQIPEHWQWQGRPVKLVDGTTITMPDTKKNQALYPQQSEQRPGLGFPIARMVAIICLSSGVILNAAMGRYKGKGGSEQGLFRPLIDSLESGDILLADRYYTGYFLVAMLMNKGVDIIFQQHATRKTDFRKGQQLGTRDHIARWKKPLKRPDWMSEAQYEHFPNELCVREFKTNKKVLVTTLLSAKHAPKKELARLNKQRWHIELDLRNIKTTLGMETLSCKTPAMNEKEMWVYFLAYNLIRLVMAQAALQSQLMPRQLSFKHTVQIWLMWSKQCSPYGEHVDTLLIMIAQIRVGNRPGRIEPRAVKRRPKHYSLLMKPREEARAGIKKYGHPKKA